MTVFSECIFYYRLQGHSSDAEFTSDTPSDKSPKKIHQVSAQSDNPTKITIKTTTLDVPNERPSRKRKHKEFASPSSESRIHVDTDGDPPPDMREANPAAGSNATPGPSESKQDKSDKCSVSISFDQNTKKLWQDLHFPYGNYTSFFRHLILLEKYWRNGDLTLSESASQKASNYVRSVKNRIEAYEGKHKRSDWELSDSTRPDLSVPALPDLPHGPIMPEGNEPEKDIIIEKEKTNSKSPLPSTSATSDTILKIPKVPKPSNSSATETSTTSAPLASPPNMPTKIRVRTDLMHLGLVARGTEPNLMESAKPPQPQMSPSKKDSFKIADLMGPGTKSPTKTTQSHPQSSNLLQLLNEPITPKNKGMSSTGGPMLGNTSLTVSKPGSSTISTSVTNSQLYKAVTSSSTAAESSNNSSSIEISFNNSIAEVLKAAAAQSQASEAKAAADMAASVAANASKPEVTITAKPMNKSVSVSRMPPKPTGNSNAADLLRISNVHSFNPQGIWTSPETADKTASATATTSAMMKTASPSGGGSIQKPVASKKSLQAATGASNISRLPHHPLADMNKLLQTASPGVAPHIVAQSNIPANAPKPGSSSGGGIIAPQPQKSSPVVPVPQKIVPKPGPLPSTVRPVQLSKPQGIQTVNKKSLNTVLDRLSGLSSLEQATLAAQVQQLQQQQQQQSKSSSSSSSRPSSASSAMASTSASSLVQQLNAPTLAAKSSSSSNKSSSIPKPARPSSSSSASASNAAAASAVNSLAAAQQLSALFGMNPNTLATQMMTQPNMMSQYNNWLNQAQAAQAAQAALLMAGAGTGLSGMNQASMQAAAVQELMLKSIQQQAAAQAAAKSSTASAAAGSANARAGIRAPPPLTHMGRPQGGQPGSSNQNKAKPNEWRWF